MLNQILLNEVKTSYITLAVSRSWKNADGIYETDFIPVRLYKGIAENTTEYCKKGDVIGVKGRIQTKQEENKNIIEIVAEKVTFLSNRKETEEE